MTGGVGDVGDETWSEDAVGCVFAGGDVGVGVGDGDEDVHVG